MNTDAFSVCTCLLWLLHLAGVTWCQRDVTGLKKQHSYFLECEDTSYTAVKKISWQVREQNKIHVVSTCLSLESACRNEDKRFTAVSNFSQSGVFSQLEALINDSSQESLQLECILDGRRLQQTWVTPSRDRELGRPVCHAQVVGVDAIKLSCYIRTFAPGITCRLLEGSIIGSVSSVNMTYSAKYVKVYSYDASCFTVIYTMRKGEQKFRLRVYPTKVLLGSGNASDYAVYTNTVAIPEVKILRQRTLYSANSPVRITCAIFWTPSPSRIEWYAGNRNVTGDSYLIHPKDISRTLNVTSVLRLVFTQNQEVTCKLCIREQGCCWKDALMVETAQSPQLVFRYQGNNTDLSFVELREGDNVSLECLVLSGNDYIVARINVTCFEDDQPIPLNKAEKHMSSMSFTLSETQKINGGHCSCSAFDEENDHIASTRISFTSVNASGFKEISYNFHDIALEAKSDNRDSEVSKIVYIVCGVVGAVILIVLLIISVLLFRRYRCESLYDCITIIRRQFHVYESCEGPSPSQAVRMWVDSVPDSLSVIQTNEEIEMSLMRDSFHDSSINHLHPSFVDAHRVQRLPRNRKEDRGFFKNCFARRRDDERNNGQTDSMLPPPRPPPRVPSRSPLSPQNPPQPTGPALTEMRPPSYLQSLKSVPPSLPPSSDPYIPVWPLQPAPPRPSQPPPQPPPALPPPRPPPALPPPRRPPPRQPSRPPPKCCRRSAHSSRYSFRVSRRMRSGTIPSNMRSGLDYLNMHNFIRDTCRNKLNQPQSRQPPIPDSFQGEGHRSHSRPPPPRPCGQRTASFNSNESTFFSTLTNTSCTDQTSNDGVYCCTRQLLSSISSGASESILGGSDHVREYHFSSGRRFSLGTMSTTIYQNVDVTFSGDRAINYPIYYPRDHFPRHNPWRPSTFYKKKRLRKGKPGLNGYIPSFSSTSSSLSRFSTTVFNSAQNIRDFLEEENPDFEASRPWPELDPNRR